MHTNNLLGLLTAPTAVGSGAVLCRLRVSCNRVVAEWRNKRITRDEAAKQLLKLEKDAYTADPDAEPDGDLTYTVASAMDVIWNRSA